MRHPVTTARISEARNRAREYPQIHSDDSISYGIARMRIIVARFDTPKEAVAYFEARDYDKQTDIERYGRAVAYQRDENYHAALEIFEDLLDKDKSVIAYHIGLGETLVALDQTSDAIRIFERALEF